MRIPKKKNYYHILR